MIFIFIFISLEYIIIIDEIDIFCVVDKSLLGSFSFFGIFFGEGILDMEKKRK